MPNPSSVIVVLEDERHEMLIRRYLGRCGMERHQVRFERSPSGHGSAEHWVQRRFAVEVRAYRNRQARATTALIVVIDADMHAVHRRLAQLEQALTENGLQPIDNAEQVARLVPKRNVETWILCLNERAVDETTDYKASRDDWNDLIPPASQSLYQWTRLNAVPPGHCIDSLRTGVNELRRLAL